MPLISNNLYNNLFCIAIGTYLCEKYMNNDSINNFIRKYFSLDNLGLFPAKKKKNHWR